jgi:DNA excision repair protein ERCC-3
MTRRQESKISDEHNAFFYSLVSSDTEEMYFSTKRQQFLIQQGYSFKVANNIIEKGDKSHLLLSTRDQQIELLERVLRLGEADAGEDAVAEDAVAEDDVSIVNRHSSVSFADRRKGSMSALSGARGTYLEYAAKR